MFGQFFKQKATVRVALLCSLFCTAFISNSYAIEAEQDAKEGHAEAIDWVWSGQRVWFDFVSQGPYQMIAYYDASRQMSVAVRKMRDVNGGPWNYHKVPSYLGWDAHNHVEVAFDQQGHIHLVGNLHANPLVYFRSTEPYNPRTLVKVDVMADQNIEQQMTYPSFFIAPSGVLHFKYRDGTSGQGQWHYNRWNSAKNTWEGLHNGVFLDGEGERGVYPKGPKIGPDGYAHVTYTWRETPTASTNHDLSYARSKDLVNWETSDGEPIKLPITLKTGEVIDPIPMNGGLLNGRTPIGFDKENRVVVTYQKYDENGDTQVFLLRKEGSEWVGTQVSSWKNSRVDLAKSGALDLPIDTSESAFVNAKGNIVVPASYRDVRWEWVLAHNDLRLIEGGPVTRALPASITAYHADKDFPFRVVPLMEEQKQASTEYYMSWQALQPNRDQARANIPLPSTLRVHHIKQKSPQ